MSYLFYSERFHFINLLNIPSFMAGMFFYLAVGFLFRYFVPKKKIFYWVLCGLFVVWAICEITYAPILSLDKIELLDIGMLCFQLAWVVLCIFVGSLMFHLFCYLSHKRPLQ